MELASYKLDRNERLEKCTPYWIDDGGHWPDPDALTLVGVIQPAPRDFKVPETVTRLTRLQLEARCLSIHARYPYTSGMPGDETTMTDAEVVAMVAAWCDGMGVA
jgi:hypothetical protein